MAKTPRPILTSAQSAASTFIATPDLAEQVDRLTEEIAAMRVRLYAAGEDNWSLRARLEAAEPT